MRLRLLGLLLVATLSGAVVGVSESARAGKVGARPPARDVAGATARLCPVPPLLRDEFQAAAADTALPLSLIVAVAQVESNLRPGARSDAGAHGLLQLMPETAAELELDPYVVGENVLAGARYLRQMLDRFDSADLALAAYNAGPTAVERTGAAPSAETLAYVKNVNSAWRRLVGCA
jgi:peptidoglycan DL-endopeptidase CwlO